MGLFRFRQSYPEFFIRIVLNINVEHLGSDTRAEHSCSRKRSAFDTATQNHNSVGAGNRLIHHPRAGRRHQQRRAKNKNQNTKRKAEAENPSQAAETRMGQM